MDLKEFKLHTVYSGISEQIKFYNSLVRQQSSSLSPSTKPGSCSSSGQDDLAITPEGCSRRQSKLFIANSIPELLDSCPCTAWVGWTGKHKHRVCLSLWQLLVAATCLLEKNLKVQPLSRYWLSSRAKKFLMLFTATDVTTDLVFSYEMNAIDLAKYCSWLKTQSFLRSISPTPLD